MGVKITESRVNIINHVNVQAQPSEGRILRARSEDESCPLNVQYTQTFSFAEFVLLFYQFYTAKRLIFVVVVLFCFCFNRTCASRGAAMLFCSLQAKSGNRLARDLRHTSATLAVLAHDVTDTHCQTPNDGAIGHVFATFKRRFFVYLIN